MKKQKTRFAIFMLLLAVTACDNADYSKSAPFDNGVYFKGEGFKVCMAPRVSL